MSTPHCRRVSSTRCSSYSLSIFHELLLVLGWNSGLRYCPLNCLDCSAILHKSSSLSLRRLCLGIAFYKHFALNLLLKQIVSYPLLPLLSLPTFLRKLLTMFFLMVKLLFRLFILREFLVAVLSTKQLLLSPFHLTELIMAVLLTLQLLFLSFPILR